MTRDWPGPSSITATGCVRRPEKARPFRWLVPLVLVVGIADGGVGPVFGSWGNAVASGIYLVLLLLELFWWPKRRAQLLANADRAAEMARGTTDVA